MPSRCRRLPRPRFGLGVLAGLRRAIVSASEPAAGVGWSSLSELDPTGEAFRYDGQLNTIASNVDVPRLVQRFRAAFGIIHGGVLTALYEHASFLREIRAEYGP